MKRQFFPPIPVTFTRRKPEVLSDQDLMRAWHGVPTEKICTDPLPRAEAVRVRLRALRRALEAREP